MADKWIVRDVLRKIERVGEDYNPGEWELEWTHDCAFDSFEEAQNHLLSILKTDHAQVVADIAALPSKLKVIEGKIRIINTSSEQDYV